jgi:uncharacterized membrane protein YphA (DoxX/SURF4 family)
MSLLRKRIQKADLTIIHWMAKSGFILLRLSIGIIFFWFGILKFFEGLSPAEDLAINTISILTLNLLPDKVIIYGLALWEVLIGIGFLLNIFLRATIFLLFVQMIGTFAPFLFFPDELFHIFPYSLTLEGQYIAKNIIIISAGIVLGGTLIRDKRSS